MYVREYVASEARSSLAPRRKAAAHRSLGQAACQLRDDVTARPVSPRVVRSISFRIWPSVRSRTTLEWGVRTCRFQSSDSGLACPFRCFILLIDDFPPSLSSDRSFPPHILLSYYRYLCTYFSSCEIARPSR
jgi:hypothetical protein